MTKESAWLKVVAAARKITGVDVTALPSGRTGEHVSLVRGMVYHILMKYYDLTREETAKMAWTDHGTVSYHILKHNSRYEKKKYYYTNYDNMVAHLFGTVQREKYNMIEELINQI